MKEETDSALSDDLSDDVNFDNLKVFGNEKTDAHFATDIVHESPEPEAPAKSEMLDLTLVLFDDGLLVNERLEGLRDYELTVDELLAKGLANLDPIVLLKYAPELTEKLDPLVATMKSNSVKMLCLEEATTDKIRALCDGSISARTIDPDLVEAGYDYGAS